MKALNKGIVSSLFNLFIPDLVDQTIYNPDTPYLDIYLSNGLLCADDLAGIRIEMQTLQHRQGQYARDPSALPSGPYTGYVKRINFVLPSSIVNIHLEKR